MCWCDTPHGALWCVGVTHRMEFMVGWCDTPHGALLCVGVTHRMELYGVLV